MAMTTRDYAPTDEVSEQQTFLTSVRQATQGMAELSQRIDALATRLVGSVPTPAGTGSAKLASVPNSVFDKVSAMGEQLNGDISFAFDALTRIERALP